MLGLLGVATALLAHRAWVDPHWTLQVAFGATLVLFLVLVVDTLVPRRIQLPDPAERRVLAARVAELRRDARARRRSGPAGKDVGENGELERALREFDQAAGDLMRELQS